VLGSVIACLLKAGKHSEAIPGMFRLLRRQTARDNNLYFDYADFFPIFVSNLIYFPVKI
jgi:hypothetical protein